MDFTQSSTIVFFFLFLGPKQWIQVVRLTYQAWVVCHKSYSFHGNFSNENKHQNYRKCLPCNYQSYAQEPSSIQPVRSAHDVTHREDRFKQNYKLLGIFRCYWKHPNQLGNIKRSTLCIETGPSIEKREETKNNIETSVFRKVGDLWSSQPATQHNSGTHNQATPRAVVDVRAHRGRMDWLSKSGFLQSSDVYFLPVAWWTTRAEDI